MKMSWHKDQTSGKVLIMLEIDEAEFAAARLNGLSGSSKISDRLLWFAKMAENQEAEETVPFEEHLKQLQRAMMVYSGDSLHDLNEQRKLYGLPTLEGV